MPSGKCSFWEKLVKGTTHRFSMPNQRRQCGDLTFRTLVMPGSEFMPFNAKTGEGHPLRAWADLINQWDLSVAK